MFSFVRFTTSMRVKCSGARRKQDDRGLRPHEEMKGQWYMDLSEGPTLVTQKESSIDGFSLGERLADVVEPRWVEFKDRGNEFFRAGHYEDAAKQYTLAFQIATCPESQMDALRSITGPMRTVFDDRDLFESIMEWLPSAPRPDIEWTSPTGTLTFSLPNLPAAITLGNRASCYAKLGNKKRAVKDAEDATKYAPEYVKAHEKLERALTALGDLKRAKEIKKDIVDYRKLCEMQAWTGPAMLISGWISYMSFMYYETQRQDLILDRLKELNTIHIGCAVSLVPFQGGQWMFFNLRYNDRGTPRKVDLFAFGPVDSRNEDMLELLPHGKASPTALKHVPTFITGCLEKLSDLDVFCITCGQGLVEHTSLIQKSLPPSHSRILVQSANSTRVSEDAGLTDIIAGAIDEIDSLTF